MEKFVLGLKNTVSKYCRRTQVLAVLLLDISRAGHPLLEKCRCRYLAKKAAARPLPLLVYKTAGAAATLEKYLAKRTMSFKYGTQ